MKAKTLLQIAKEINTERTTKKINYQEMELAVEFANGNVSISQCRGAMGGSKTSSNYIYRLAIAIKAGVALGAIEPLKFKTPTH